MSGFLSTSGPDPTVTATQGAATAGMKQAGQAYSNYRQLNRDNYANQLSNQSSLYQGLMNRMQSAYGGQGAPNTAQMSNNPMSLAQTTVGATHGSNAAGNGIQFSGGNEPTSYQVGPDGKIDPNTYGLIGKMGLQGQGQWASADPNGNSQVQQSMDVNGNPIAQGGNLNNISTNNSNQYTAPGQGSSAPGQFSFAPRRP